MRSRMGIPRILCLRSSRSSRGVGLIETVVAIGILAVAMSLLARILVGSLEQSQMARQAAQGILLAQERMEDVLAHSADLATWESGAKDQFPFDQEANLYRFQEPERAAYRWDWSIQGMEGQPGLSLVAVGVMWKRPHQEKFGSKCELQSIVAVPGQAPAGTEPSEPEPAETTPMEGAG